MSDERLTFKAMCEKFDVTPRTLRYYEYIELLSPEKEGRSRFYTPREVARMTLILRGRKWGFSLEEIRQWLEIYQQQGNAAQQQMMVELADRQLDVLIEQKKQLEEAIESLKATRDEVAKDLN